MRAHDFLRERTQRTTDDFSLGSNELLDAPGEYRRVRRTYLCEPSVCLLSQPFPGQRGDKRPAECRSHQHGRHAEAKCRGDGGDASDNEAERGGAGVGQRRIKGRGACAGAPAQSHDQRMNCTVAFANRVLYPFLTRELPNSRTPRGSSPGGFWTIPGVWCYFCDFMNATSARMSSGFVDRL